MARGELALGWERARRNFDSLLALWRLLASAQFALVIIGFLALAGLLAVLLPQVPPQLRGNPAAIGAWVELQKGTFGPFTESMDRVGLFNVVSTWWFLTGLGLLAVSAFVYTVSRLPSTWQNIVRPQERVPAAFFDRAANRAAFDTEESALPRLEALLRKRRFQVRRFQEGDTTYLFADRFAWAQMGTFVSHLALLIFIAGALASCTGRFSSGLFIAEGATNPVFPVSHPDQMQVEVIDAVAIFDEDGSPLDYRTELVVYQGGKEVARGVSTVNDPVSYGGYNFHQAAYFGEGAALRVRDTATGNTLYRETLALEDLVPAPAITVRDAQGALLLDDVIVPIEQVEGVWGTPLMVPGGGGDFWVGIQQVEEEAWQLVVFGTGDNGAGVLVPEGASRQAGDLEFALREVVALPSIGTPNTRTPPIPGDNAQALVVMSESPEKEPYLTVINTIDSTALVLYPDAPVQVGDQEYLFEGRREFAGIEVRRDPGTTFIWVGAGLLLAGLGITFYVPRLRLWARVRRQETVIAGPAEQSGSFQAETKWLARELDVRAGEGKEEGDVHA